MLNLVLAMAPPRRGRAFAHDDKRQGHRQTSIPRGGHAFQVQVGAEQATPRRASPWWGEGDASAAWTAIVASAIHSTAVLRLWLAEFEARPAEHREPERTVSKLGRLAGRAVADFRKRMREP